MVIPGFNYPVAVKGLGDRSVLLGQFDDGAGNYVDGLYDVGCLVGYHATYGWTKARCDAASPIPAQLVVVQAAMTGETTFAFRYVVIQDESMAFTPGVPLYLAALAAGGGKWSVTAPVGVDDLVQIVGFAIAPGEIICEPGLKGVDTTTEGIVKVGGKLEITHDPLFCLYAAGNVRYFMADSGDFIFYDRASDYWGISAGGATVFEAYDDRVRLQSASLEIYNISKPATPSAGYIRIYPKVVGGVIHLFTLDHAGTEIDLFDAEASNGVITGDLAHSGPKVGFFSTAPVVQPDAYTPSNVTPDRSFDANSTSLDEVADVLGTLIADLKAYGLLK